MSQEHSSTQQGDYPLARIQERAAGIEEVLGRHQKINDAVCSCGNVLMLVFLGTSQELHTHHVAIKLAEWMEENR